MTGRVLPIAPETWRRMPDADRALVTAATWNADPITLGRLAHALDGRQVTYLGTGSLLPRYAALFSCLLAVFSLGLRASDRDRYIDALLAADTDAEGTSHQVSA